MDQRTRTDKALLEGYLRRHHGPVAYIDESFQVPIGTPALGFYILAATIYHSSEIPAARDSLLLASDSARWHTTDEYHLGNFTGILRVASEVGSWATNSIVVLDEFGDEIDLEFSRKKCLSELIRQLEDRDCSMIVYERRSTRSHVNSDTALIAKLISSGLVSRSTRVLGSSPAAETLLWAPDIIAWSLRRIVTSCETKWLEAVNQTIEIVFISEPSKPLPKEKRPGPALAYPGPGLSVDHRGEGIMRSSTGMFAYNKAFGQALTQLLVIPRTPILEPSLAKEQLLELFSPRLH